MMDVQLTSFVFAFQRKWWAQAPLKPERDGRFRGMSFDFCSYPCSRDLQLILFAKEFANHTPDIEFPVPAPDSPRSYFDDMPRRVLQYAMINFRTVTAAATG